MDEITPRFECVNNDISRDASIIKQDLEHEIEVLVADNHSKETQIKLLKEQCSSVNCSYSISPHNNELENCTYIHKNGQAITSMLKGISNKLDHSLTNNEKEMHYSQIKHTLKMEILAKSKYILEKEIELSQRESSLLQREKQLKLKEQQFAYTHTNDKENITNNDEKDHILPYVKLISRLSKPISLNKTHY